VWIVARGTYPGQALEYSSARPREPLAPLEPFPSSSLCSLARESLSRSLLPTEPTHTRSRSRSLLRHCHILFVLVRDSLVLLSLCTCVLFCARCELFRARCLCLELAASALFVITTKTRPPAYRCRALVVHTPFSTRRTVPRLRPTALRVFSR